MSYETKYHPHLCNEIMLFARRRKRFGFMKWACLVAALALGIILRDKDFGTEFLIPGDSAVTVAAIEDFTEDLKKGVSFAAAFEDFCVEIVVDD